MFYKTIDDYDAHMDFVRRITKMKSCMPFRNILNGYVLEDFQCVDVLTALARKESIIGHDTGMGKTLIASSIIRALHNENHLGKYLVVLKTNQFQQTPAKIRKATGMSVVAISSKGSDLENKMYNGSFLNSDIVIIAAEVLNDVASCAVLLQFRKRFRAIIVDELHEFTNFNDADRAFMLKSMMSHIEYKIGLTATPMTTELDQFTRALAMLDRETYSNYKDTKTKLVHGNLDIEKSDPGVYIRRTRSGLGIANDYLTHVHVTEPHQHQANASGINMFEITKGEGAYNQVAKLIEIIDNEPGKGLVYIRHHSIRKFVEGELEKAGIPFASINGLVTGKQRGDIMNKFNEGGEGAPKVVLTSVTTSLDLDCDFVIFYEFTVDAKQMIGRAERGLIPKTIHIHFIFVRYTEEISYFRENIYERSLVVQQVLRRDYGELVEVGKTLDKL
ncbi:hypothetical protein UT300012_24250 [Paraclostridium bifermentans]